VTLQGRIYPALPAEAKVKLVYGRNGSWHKLSVATTRQTEKLPEGQVAKSSVYRVTVNPRETTTYYFSSGNAKSPATTIMVLQ